jgi:predicted  nucleic acid-binding Zn-ribbon protein
MFGKFWKKEVNSNNLYTLDEINEIKDEIGKRKIKIRNCEQVITAFKSLKNPNHKRIKANEDNITKLQQEIAALEKQLEAMEDKNVNRKKT